MNNKAIIEFGFRKDMKNSADLRGCYPPRPSASVDNTLLDLQNSSLSCVQNIIILCSKYLGEGNLVSSSYVSISRSIINLDMNSEESCLFCIALQA